MQEAYWIGMAAGESFGGVNAHYYAELDGSGVEPNRLDAAVRLLLARHSMLRATFLEGGRQQVLPTSPWAGLTVYDLRSLAGGEAAERTARLRDRLTHRRLRVDDGEVFDVQVSLLPGGSTRVHINIDMLVADALSFQIILDELAQFYERPGAALPPIGYSFAQYLAERSGRRSGEWEQDRAYWQARVPGLPGPPQLPIVGTGDDGRAHGVSRRFLQVDREEWDELAARAQRHGLTVSSVLFAAFAEVIGGFSREPRFLLNLPTFDRDTADPGAARLVGDFTNLIIVDVDLADPAAFRERALDLQRRVQTAVGHAAYSGVEVLRDLARSRAGDRVFAPVVFTSAVSIGELFGERVRRTLGAPVWTVSQAPQVWLDQQVTERDGGLLFNWDVVEEVFPAGVVDAMFDAYVGLLRWLRSGDGEWADPVPALVPSGQAATRAKVNATEGPQPRALLHEPFFERASAAPGDTALVWADRGRLTYGELAAKARRIASLLIERGVRPGDTVAVTVPKGPTQVEAVLGVLLAGGVYVPVGIDQPARRRDRMYASARAKAVLTDSATASACEWPAGPAVLPVDGDLDGIAALVTPPPADCSALAYIIFTSGSTGEPKGVEITHGSAVNTVADVTSRFSIAEGDVVLAVSALDFDLSVFDVFGLLSVGGTVALVGEDDRREASAWIGLIQRWGVTVWNSVPALLDMLLAAAPAGALGSLRVALLSGDWIGLDLPPRLAAAAPGCRCIALGGATEAAIWSNAFEVGDLPAGWTSIPYGFPLRNQKFRVVDACGRDRPDWVAGELWIGGIGVAQGYRGDAERTARQFVTDDGERWYRTGDFGRYWPDGTLEFLGRADQQVKIRGHRVELGEIEAGLAAHPGVARAVAVALPGPPPRLAAAVVPAASGLDPSSLDAHLAAILPAHMRPEIVAVDDIALTPNGKVARGAIEALLARRFVTGAEAGPQASELEIAIAALWGDVLGAAAGPRPDDSFFAAGGDSLLATRLATAIRNQFGVDVLLREFFAQPTVRGLASLVAARVPSGDMEEGTV
jgi:amino acid adenylation domain-containing protein